MIRLLVIFAVAGLITAHFPQWSTEESTDSLKPPNCNCTDNGNFRHRTGFSAGNKFAQWHQICGTDNVTYASKCEFVNRAFADPTLGQRCHGPCPCDKDKDSFGDYKSWDSNEKEAICLNTGHTVYGREELMDAKKLSLSVGKRCKGECSECSANLKCPPRHGGHRPEFPKTRDFAPNCTCKLSDSPHFNKFLSSKCGQQFLQKRQVCGSDNFTYADKCDFKNKQASMPGLGKRCSGPCPCDTEVSEQQRRPWKAHQQERGHFMRMKLFESAKPYCLNNGTTIYGWEEKEEALRLNLSLGVRCKGECQECQTASIFCPFDWVKSMEERERERPHPPNCTCPNRFGFGFQQRHRHHGLCGNDNKTYDNICQLINNQTSNPTLGFRCLGKCPCKNRTADLINLTIAEKEEDDFQDPSDESTNQVAFDENSENMSEIDSNEIYDAEKVRITETEEASISSRNPAFGDDGELEKDEKPLPWQSHERHHRRRHHHWRRPVCLTNGKTVRGWRNVSAALNADASLGIRCRGHCDYCFNHTRCPRVPSEEEIQSFRNKAKEWRNRWREMTTESPENPPNCVCASKDAERNDIPVHPGKQTHRGRHGFGMHGEFSVCGNDNVTYQSWCDLVNNQSKNIGLGHRCWGACPCSVEDFETSGLSEKSNDSLLFDSSFALCLTNGKTVHSFAEKMKALGEDMSLGIRCMNECSICRENLKCPRIFKPRHSSHSGWRKHGDFHSQNHPRFGIRLQEFQGIRNSENKDQTAFWELKGDQPSFEFERSLDYGLGWPRMRHQRPWGHKWGHRSQKFWNDDCSDEEN